VTLLSQLPVSRRIGVPSNSNFHRVFAADNFVLEADTGLHQLTYWGFYENAPIGPPDDEKFTVVFRKDDNGIPGEVLQPPLTQVLAHRSLEAGEVSDVYRYEVGLPKLHAAAGTYWVTIASDGEFGSGGDPPPDEPAFSWLRGELDSFAGGQGLAVISTHHPAWQLSEGDLAFRICGASAGLAVPSLNRFGAFVLIGIISVAGALSIKRRCPTTRSS
jgi:hypothetical protein